MWLVTGIFIFGGLFIMILEVVLNFGPSFHGSLKGALIVFACVVIFFFSVDSKGMVGAVASLLTIGVFLTVIWGTRKMRQSLKSTKVYSLIRKMFGKLDYRRSNRPS